MKDKKKKWMILVCFCAIMLSFGVNAEEMADKSSEFVYVCMDQERPCISGTSGLCPHCGKETVKKQLTIETLMESLAAITKVMNKDISAGKIDYLRGHAESILFISSKLTLLPPKKNTEKVNDYMKFAGELAEKANAMIVASESKDDAALKTNLKSFEALCKSCHSVFR